MSPSGLTRLGLKKFFLDLWTGNWDMIRGIGGGGLQAIKKCLFFKDSCLGLLNPVLKIDLRGGMAIIGYSWQFPSSGLLKRSMPGPSSLHLRCFFLAIPWLQMFDDKENTLAPCRSSTLLGASPLANEHRHWTFLPQCGASSPMKFYKNIAVQNGTHFELQWRGSKCVDKYPHKHLPVWNENGFSRSSFTFNWGILSLDFCNYTLWEISTLQITNKPCWWNHAVGVFELWLEGLGVLPGFKMPQNVHSPFKSPKNGMNHN